MGNRKLVLTTPTLCRNPDAYCPNVKYDTVPTLETECLSISYQAHLYVLAQVINRQLIADINILHWLQSYEEQLFDPSKFTIVGFYCSNVNALNTAMVAGKTQLLRPTGKTTTHFACALLRPSKIKSTSVEVTRDFEDISKAPYNRTFQPPPPPTVY